MMTDTISFGDRRLVGQQDSKTRIERILASGRLSHAYLFTGPKGSGKTAFALALAEVINGIDHYTDLKGESFSKKSSWFTHPDIHTFIPMPSSADSDDLKERLMLLQNDPYEIVDFTLRPALSDPDSSKNLQAFYPIEYFHETIRPVTVYKPNEGRKTVVIITEIHTMRKEAANAFLKLLEEPSENVVILLTSSKPDQLLPTIISRCQQIRLQPLLEDEVAQGLMKHDGLDKSDAHYLARVSDGSYALARFFDVENLKKSRQELVEYLRYSYTQDAVKLVSLIDGWNRSLNRESQIALCNTMEQFLRDIMIYRESENPDLITNVDQLNVIKKFCQTMAHAKIEIMILHLQHLKETLFQNIQTKLVFTVLSMRFASLMRGEDPYISTEDTWRHLPAYTEI
ncbi:MAG TPA: AAA family ATPase [Balneolaceae bacterium]|nr:AAA family ATPase [Balneolaceae bacterium]